MWSSSLRSGGGEDAALWVGSGDLVVGDSVDYASAVVVLGHVDDPWTG